MTEYICPHCKSPINDDEALLCLFCGESLNRHSNGALGMMRSMQWLIAVIVGIIVLSFLISILGVI